MSFGYAGKTLWVDLVTGRVREEPTEKYSEWIGGRGVGSYLLTQLSGLNDNDPANQDQKNSFSSLSF